MRLPSAGLWHNRNFVKLWTAQTISLLGSSVSFLALPLVAVSFLNATPVQMGILAAANALPALLLGLFVGVWVDRYRRRPILIATNIGQAVLLTIISGAAALHVLRMEYLYVLAFCIAVFKLCFNVANQSLLPALVGREQLVEGNSKLEMSSSGVAIVGPGVAGGLIQLVTAPLAILFDAASFVIAAIFITAIDAPETSINPAQHQQSVWPAIGAGLRLVVGDPALRSITAALGTVYLFISMIDSVLLLFLTRELQLPPGLIGILFGCGSIGFLLGTVLQGHVSLRFGPRLTLMIGLVLTGCGDLLIPSVSGTFPRLVIFGALLIGQFCYGLGRTIFNISQMSLRQSITPDTMQGRMNATTRFVMAGLMALGGIVGGLLGVVIGLRWTLVIASMGEILTAIWLLPLQSPAPVVAHDSNTAPPPIDEQSTF